MPASVVVRGEGQICWIMSLEGGESASVCMERPWMIRGPSRWKRLGLVPGGNEEPRDPGAGFLGDRWWYEPEQVVVA